MAGNSLNVALVTGASRGFGAAMAEVLAANGYHVIALARTVGGLEELDDRIQKAGGTATLVPLDICDEEGLKRLCVSIHERWGQLDLWVHSAIFAGPLSPVGHIPLSDWDKTLAVNIRATQRLVEMIEPLLNAGNGTAVLPVDDIAGAKFFASYGAAKAAQKAIWDSWAAETTKIGPTVLTFAPNPMPTALRARFYPGEDRDALTPAKTEAARLLQSLGKALS
jgi:NAD(P)-dependent dehydrogenase (short-subunit alcohol dehydrogenase family)